MNIIYDGITLEICRVNEWTQRRIHDDSETDYLWTHFVIDVQCVWSPAATANNKPPFQGGPYGAPAPPGSGLLAIPLGDIAPSSVAALRHRLLQKRKILQVLVGNIIVLESPQIFVFDNRPGTPGTRLRGQCDARTGPDPIHVNVVEIQGTKTMLVHFRIQTWLNECPKPSSSLLSNRWQMEHEIDELFYTTRTISGQAIFRKDLLTLEGVGIDEFRNVFAHPVPNNFQRTKVRVNVSEDGTIVNWQVRDEENTLNLGLVNPIVKIEGRYHEGFRKEPFAFWPTVKVGAEIRTWGRRETTRNALVKATALAAASWNLVVSAIIGTTTIECEVDMVDKYCSFSWEGIINPTYSFFGFLGGLNISSFPEDINTIAGPVAVFADGPNPRPPNSNAMRGRYVGQIVAQALSSPCSNPTVPQNPGPAKDVGLH